MLQAARGARLYVGRSPVAVLKLCGGVYHDSTSAIVTTRNDSARLCVRRRPPRRRVKAGKERRLQRNGGASPRVLIERMQNRSQTLHPVSGTPGYIGRARRLPCRAGASTSASAPLPDADIHCGVERVGRFKAHEDAVEKRLNRHRTIKRSADAHQGRRRARREAKT